ncbi:lipoyl(octanoyl) transferase LipB [Nitratifractor sp.]|uniref:lipoyl(octanoyl) transferase LipB n=1 Tax=Nitratifractor sp. TaxID=2268144 RepID=UPI0025D7CBFE|nr:lipoyl(octanoyl) transferase LipB [Nitratifractor sp.]
MTIAVYQWGMIPYAEARQRMEVVHNQAVRDGQDHLIFCEHPPCFTVGADDRENWPVETIRSDRGGSITCHSPGQLVAYLCFHAPEPARFYRRVIHVYNGLFEALGLPAEYRRKNPGWYIENRKIASLGFRYRDGVSLHGVSLNVDVDLALHRQVAPCGLEGIVATSLKAEGIEVTVDEIRERLVHLWNASGSEVFSSEKP